LFSNEIAIRAAGGTIVGYGDDANLLHSAKGFTPHSSTGQDLFQSVRRGTPKSTAQGAQ